MSGSPRYTLNRTLAVLVPKQPFIDWLNRVDPDDHSLTIDDLRNDNEVFLIPQFSDHLSSVKWIEKRWHYFFEHMLLGWVTNESMWPQDRTLAMFKDWFKIETHSMVWDMTDDPLAVEDWHTEEELTQHHGKNHLH